MSGDAVASIAPGVFFSEMIDKARERPDFEVLTFDNHPHPDEVLTYSELVAKGNKLAKALTEAGIGHGDAFSIMMRNHPEMVIALYAASALGAVMVPIDPRSKGEKLRYQIDNSDSRGVLFTADMTEAVEEALKELPEVKVVGIAYKDGCDTPVSAKYPSLNELLGGPDTALIERDNYLMTDPVLMIHTSGTTGNPKGVVMRGDRLMSGSMIAQLVWQYTSEDRLYTGLSLTHGNAIIVTLMPSLLLTIPAVISQRFTKSRIWDLCRQHGCTTFSLLGGMMMGIYSEPQKDNDGENPVRKVLSAGTPSAIWTAFEKRFNVEIHEWYAAVEGGFAHNPPGEGPVGSFGKNIEALMDMKVVREDDTECDPGELGELISRAAGGGETKVEYHKNPEASEAKTRDGWLRSGDIVHRDEDGWYYFDFRKGGGLRRQGDFIMPEYVERAIAEHPDVNDVCVYGITAASGAPGESDLVAAVVSVPDTELDIKSIFKTCVEGLEANSVPSYIQVVDEIPKTVSEKNLDRLLKEAFDPEAPNVYAFENHR